MPDDTNNDANIIIPSPDAGGGFKFEMAAMNLLLGHWQKLLAGVIILLVGVGAYGQFQNNIRDSQRLAHRTTSELRSTLEASLVASLDSDATSQVALYGSNLESLLFVTNNPTDDQQTIIRDAADKFVAHANEIAGVAAIDAHLTAADLYRRVGDTSAQATSLSAVIAISDDAVLVGATVALANIDISAENTDAAIRTIQALTTSNNAFVAQSATLAQASMEQDAGLTEQARTTYSGFLTRWPNSERITQVNDLLNGLPTVDVQ